MSRVLKETRNILLLDGSNSDQLSLSFEVVLDDQEDFSSWSVAVTSKEHPKAGRTYRAGPNDQAVIQLSFPGDGLMIEGILSCHQTRGGAFLIEADQFVYGFADRPRNLLGTLAVLDSDAPDPWPPIEPPPIEPPPVMPPPIVPLEDRSVPLPSVKPAAGRDGELFPYVYMRIWPEPSPSDREMGFVGYPFPLDGPPSGQLVQELARLGRSGAPDAREQMERAAIDYIEGHPYPDAPFVADPSPLPAPLGAYPKIYGLAAQAQDPARVVAEIWKILGVSCEEAPGHLDSPEHRQLLARIWQSYFALVIALGYDGRRRDALARLLVVDHLLCWLAHHCASSPTCEELATLVRATLVLPAVIFPLPPAGASPIHSPPSEAEWIVPYAIGDLQMVQHRLVRYRLGDLARVENVMPGERRESVRRTASRVTDSTARLVQDETIRSTGARSRALTSEMSRAIADIVATTTYGPGSDGFNITYGPPKTTLSGGWTLETKPASADGKPSSSEVTRAAKLLVQKAAERVAHRVLEARSVSTSHEAEESVTSILDNTGGATRRLGIYRWLNEVYEASIVNYANRLVLELLLVDPAARYLRRDSDLPGDAYPPAPPAALGIESFEDITREGFAYLAARYPSGTLELPPEPRRTVSGWVQSGEPLSLTIPEGYVATEAAVSYLVAPDQTTLRIRGLVGQTQVDIQATAGGSVRLPMAGDGGTVQILLQTSAPLASPPVELEPVQLAVEIAAKPGERVMAAWQLKTFQAIQAAYSAQLGAYQGQGSSVQGDPAATAPQPRYGYRAIERRELQRGAFDLLERRLRLRTGPDQEGPSGWPSGVDIARPRYLRFFEDAFEWNELSYRFFDGPAQPGARPARKTATAAAGDARFAEFLEAGYAQLLVPVRPSEAMAVLYFLASGMAWDGSEESIPTCEADLPLTGELKKLRHRPHDVRRVGDPWEIVVPTTILVLQEGSAAALELCTTDLSAATATATATATGDPPRPGQEG